MPRQTSRGPRTASDCTASSASPTRWRWSRVGPRWGSALSSLLLRARPGSRHRYDVIDTGELNPELGTRADFARLVQALHGHGMGLVIDIVPDRISACSTNNAWWLDVQLICLLIKWWLPRLMTPAMCLEFAAPLLSSAPVALARP